MPSITSLIPTLAALAALAQAGPLPQSLVKRTGCYGSGLLFSQLHGIGYSGDATKQVEADIRTTCSKAAGQRITAESPFWLCTHWEKTSASKDEATECYDNCHGDTNCQSLCQVTHGTPDLSDDGYNHIDWAIEVRDGQADAEIDYETCKAAFETELGGCSMGSEQNHEGFWFRIDPSARRCPA